MAPPKPLPPPRPTKIDTDASKAPLARPKHIDIDPGRNDVPGSKPPPLVIPLHDVPGPKPPPRGPRRPLVTPLRPNRGGGRSGP
ncbi:MAG: hypothetical protein ACOZJX_11205 [Pseudomonadota bacterium]